MNKTHDEMVSEWMKDPAFREEYDKLEAEFQLLEDDILAARNAAGLTQAQVAERMGTTQSSVARLEKGVVSGSLPSMSMLKRYAQVVGKNCMCD